MVRDLRATRRSGWGSAASDEPVGHDREKTIDDDLLWCVVVLLPNPAGEESDGTAGDVRGEIVKIKVRRYRVTECGYGCFDSRGVGLNDGLVSMRADAPIQRCAEEASSGAYISDEALLSSASRLSRIGG